MTSVAPQFISKIQEVNIPCPFKQPSRQQTQPLKSKVFRLRSVTGVGVTTCTNERFYCDILEEQWSKSNCSCPITRNRSKFLLQDPSRSKFQNIAKEQELASKIRSNAHHCAQTYKIIF